MRDYRITVPVAAPVDGVWRVMVDVENLPELASSMTEVVLDPPGALADGSSAVITQPRLGTATWTVTEFVPGRAFCWRSARPGVATVGEHIVDVDPAGGGTRLHLRITHEGALAWLAGLLYGRLTRQYMGLEAAGIKRAAEAAHRG